MNKRQPRQDVFPQCGVVTSVKKDSVYRAKVYLPLLDIETDYIRIGSQYVGAGWGLYSPLHSGNEVLVSFPNGDLNNGVVVCRLYSEECDPAPAEGDCLTLVHESGSALRFKPSGDVELDIQGNLILAGGGPAVARVGDTVVVAGKTGTIISGSGKVNCGG